MTPMGPQKTRSSKAKHCPECVKVGGKLSKVVDGDLKPEEKTATLKHLKHCSSCQGQVKAMTHLVKACQKLGVVKAPKGLHQRLKAMLMAKKGPEKKGPLAP
jgi:anti-sigma factor RsiW